MSDKMVPVPFKVLCEWILSEYANHKTLFGIPDSKFFKPSGKAGMDLFGEHIETAVGPAAGPHTQLTQNILSSYLTGGRFIELKTVQKLDDLKIDKPCIDASDECYNVEWSQELSLDESFDEYVKSWILIHFVKEIFGLSHNPRGFIFNMSVGYDLAGIKTERMNRFIDELIDAGGNKLFCTYKNLIAEFITEGSSKKILAEHFSLSEEDISGILKKIENISPLISNSVTLSTMHGCPPQEIEAIARYLIAEKKLNTYVKLNPTLLGYDFVKSVLSGLGYKEIELDISSFEHDLKYDDAVPMIKRLKIFAAENNLVFGIKLSNTLGVKNKKKLLPGSDMYMSGRSLFPLTINLANKIAAEFNGDINISYSGGANSENIHDILSAGIAPVTLATDLLKPGGYFRLNEISKYADTVKQQESSVKKIDLDELSALAGRSLRNKFYSKEKRQIESIKTAEEIPLFDCFMAPCQQACPIHQDVASYIKLVEEERYEDAYELIVSKNPLPHITGYICDHQCMYHCTRWDYDEPVLIRALKTEAALKGFDSYIAKFKNNFTADADNIKVAVIGAGPSGLSAAYFLAKSGFDVTIFEKEMNAGGIVKNVLPKFRLPEEAIQKDIEFIERHGIKFIFGAEPDFSIKKLKREGYKYIYIAVGADLPNNLELEGENIFDAIPFLKDFREEKNLRLGKTVAVIGGGNSAMDSARAAKRCGGVENVYLIYRRSRTEMPADKEEFYAALDDRVEFLELLQPANFENGILKCQRMELGEIGKDGRRISVPLRDEFIELQIDSLISAVGEHADTALLEMNGIVAASKNISESNETNLENVFIGGDFLRGPSTVVQAIADGRKSADAIIRKEKASSAEVKNENYFIDGRNVIDAYESRKGIISHESLSNLHSESVRCLGCNLLCNKCVEVCPNRANIPIITKSSLMKDINQIVHLDSLCNECGNCETFCPYNGAPYKAKLTYFSAEKDFEAGSNDGFYFKKMGGNKLCRLRIRGKEENIVFSEADTINDSAFEKSGEINKAIELIKAIKKNYSYLLSI